MSKTLIKSTAKWVFTPKELFVEPFVCQYQCYELHFENGTVIATSNQPKAPISRDELMELEKNIFGILQAKSVGGVDYQAVTLNDLGVSNYFSDGMEGEIHYSTGGIGLGGTVEYIDLDKDGKVIYDPRVEKEKKARKFLEKVHRHQNNDVLRKLLESYDAANRNSGNEFVHLYEIRDALVKFFKKESIAKKELGFSSQNWNLFGKYTNDGELEQSRHRGLHLGKHRKATPEELATVRNLAREMIEKYLDYLDIQQAAPKP